MNIKLANSIHNFFKLEENTDNEVHTVHLY